MFSQVKKFVYFFFLTIGLSNSFAPLAFSAQINPQEGNLEDDRITEFAEFMQRFTLDEIKDDNKNAQEPLVTQALLETLTDEDKKILASFDEINDEKDLTNLIHLTLLHYHITELYLTEKIAVKAKNDKPAFDKILQSLLIGEQSCYENLSKQSKELWNKFQKHLASHDSQFNFDSFKIMLLARQELCSDVKTFLKAFFSANELYDEKNFQDVEALKNSVKQQYQKLFLQEIRSLRKDIKTVNVPHGNYILFQIFKQLFKDNFENAIYCDAHEDYKKLVVHDVSIYEKTIPTFHVLVTMLPQNSFLQGAFKQTKILYTTGKRCSQTYTIMRENHFELQKNFEHVYENAQLFKTLYALLHKATYRRLVQINADIKIMHGTLKNEQLPEDIFPLHQILNFKSKESLNTIINFNSFLLNNLLESLKEANINDDKEIHVTFDPEKLWLTLSMIQPNQKEDFINLPCTIWDTLPKTLHFWLSTRNLWLSKRTEGTRFCIKYFNVIDYFSEILKKHIASLQEKAKPQEVTPELPPKKEAKKKNKEQAQAAQPKKPASLEAKTEAPTEVFKSPLAASKGKKQSKKITWQQRTQALWHYFFTTQDLIELDSKHIAIHHYDKDGYRTMWSVLELDEKENKALSENYDVKSLKQDRFHCIPEAMTFYLNRAQWLTKKDLATKGTPGSKLNQSLAKPIEDTESHPLTDDDKIVFIKAKIEPYGDTVPSALLDIPTAQRFFGLRTGVYAFIFRNGVCRHAMFHEDKVTAAFHQR